MQEELLNLRLTVLPVFQHRRKEVWEEADSVEKIDFWRRDPDLEEVWEEEEKEWFRLSI